MKMDSVSSYFPLQTSEKSPLPPSAREVRVVPRSKRRVSRMLYIVAAVLLFGVFLTLVNIYELKQMQMDHQGGHGAEVEAQGERIIANNKRKVWVHGKKIGSGYLAHVFNVFERIGYQVTQESTDWDVLWSHDYPFTSLKEKLVNMKPHQRVNHWPGSGYVTNKVNLATSKDIKHIPKAFKIPKEKQQFLDFIKRHPDMMWVQKGNTHRGVKILKSDQMDLTSDNTFVQQYVDDPYVISGRRFDIGIYTTVTSINPLRVYVNNGDWLVRFCPSEYYPFNPDDKNKYVISDDYRPVWKIPKLEKLYTELGFTFKESVLAHMRSEGIDTDRLLEDLFESIRSVYLSKEQALITSLAKYPGSKHFFEMVRFDFVLDKKLNIYLMEVNMSPNLSSGHFAPNKLLYEQTVFSMLSLVGVARSVTNDGEHSNKDEQNMLVSTKDLRVYSDHCMSEHCEENCLQNECKFCSECLTPDQTSHLQHAYQEHMNRNRWRRVLPKPFKDQDAAIHWKSKLDTEFQNLTTKNKWMSLWFRGKCMQDITWCF